MPRLRLILLTLAVFACRVPHAHAADWMRLRSANFTVEGDVSAGQLREIALRFEQFREVLGRLVPNARLVTRTPLTVVVFAFQREFKPIQPLYQGRPVDSAGYAIVTPYGTSIALSLEYGDNAYPLIYHEYGHVLISDALPRAPLWVQEGLAEYYKTFTLSGDGRSATVGLPLSAGELGVLRGRKLLPMAEFLAADHDSKMYNVGDERRRFYVQCWALVHYLLAGSKTRAGQFDDFLNRLSRGVPADAALAAAIPDAAKLESEVSLYLDQPAFAATQHTSRADRLTTERSFSIARMSPAEAEASIGRLLVQQQRYDEARSRLSAALKLDPESGSAQVGLGLIDLMQDRPLEAMAPLRKGASLANGDATAHFAVGLAAIRCLSPECAKQPGLREMALTELGLALELVPNFPDALSYLSHAELVAGADLGEAERHAKAAVALLPGREDYRLNLAQVYMGQKEFTRAQEVLGPMAAASPNPEFKAAARQLLGRLAQMKNAAEAQARSAAAGAAGGTPVEDAGADHPPADASPMPVFRQLRGEERRLEGSLETVLCPPAGGVIIVVRDRDGAHQFSSPALAAIDFIAYGAAPPEKVTCGTALKDRRVYATFRAPAKGEPPLQGAIEGRIVALEFLPRPK